MGRIWKTLGSIHLTMVIIAMMAADLIRGYFMLRDHAHVFHPLNDLGFVKWAATWGRESLNVTAWLFILVGLLALLSLNTFVCTTDRVVALWHHRHRFPSLWRFILRLGPHIMHYSMLIMFLGYLFSYVFGTSYPTQILLPGRTVTVAATRIGLERLDIKYHPKDADSRMAKRAKDVQALLRFTNDDNTEPIVLGMNRPALFGGLSVHLMDFSPKKQSSGMNRREYISVIVKQDPGTGFYFCGMFLFTIGLLLYVQDKRVPAGHRKKTSHPGSAGQEGF